MLKTIAGFFTRCMPDFSTSDRFSKHRHREAAILNRNNNCMRINDEVEPPHADNYCCVCILCCPPFCHCSRSRSFSKVNPAASGSGPGSEARNYPQSSAASLRSRMEASSSFPSCTAVSAIPLKAYSQFSHPGSHPQSQIESVLEGLRKKSTDSRTMSPLDGEVSVTEVSSTDQLQIEIPIVSQKPFYIL